MPQHEGQGREQKFAHERVPPFHAQAQALLGRHTQGQHKGAKGRAEGHPHAIAGHAVHVGQQASGQRGLRSLRGCQPGQQQAHGNDGSVIDQRGQRRNAELTPHEQQGRDACPAQKENLCGQDDAHKKGKPPPLLRRKAGGHHLRQPGRKGQAANGQQGGGSRHPAENAGKKAPCVRLILLKPAGQQGDDGDGHKAARQQIIDDVRHHKGGEIHVGFAARAELP